MRQLIIAVLIILFAACITKGMQDLRQQQQIETRFRQYEDSLLLKMEADKNASKPTP
jgi:hypothetical protein